MKKSISKFLQSDKGIILLIITVIFFSTWGYMLFTQPIVTDIQYSYKGIKYQAGNYEHEEPINIEITGTYTYTKTLGSNEAIFKGDIIVDGEMNNGHENEYYFSEETNHNVIEWYSFRGDLFIVDMFKEISISILEPNEDGGYSFSYKDGWIISAPADNRTEAVKISNRLIKKLNKNISIK